jgi:CubicO group peptidase (beta-lactamase class C family)
MQQAIEHVMQDILVGQPAGTAMQVTVQRNGQRLADAVLGTSNVTEDTPFVLFSVSKVLTTLAVLHLLDAGLIDLDMPIADIWREFGRDGKASATIRHALMHQAGIPAPHLYGQLFLWPFWRLVTADVAATRAVFMPGTQTGYHLVNFGFILGEVVRRVSGMPLDRYLDLHFFQPLGMAHTNMRIPHRLVSQSPRLLTTTRQLRNTAWLFNLPIIRQALIPAACAHSTARDLATLFQMLVNGGEWDGRRYLKAETVKMATRSDGDVYDTYVRTHMNWGLGFILGGGAHANPDRRKNALGVGSSEQTFAGMGMGTCMVWADKPTGLVTAFTTNLMLDDELVGQRWSAISNAVWDHIAD